MSFKNMRSLVLERGWMAGREGKARETEAASGQESGRLGFFVSWRLKTQICHAEARLDGMNTRRFGQGLVEGEFGV
jgi:hypothetical protein